MIGKHLRKKKKKIRNCKHNIIFIDFIIKQSISLTIGLPNSENKPFHFIPNYKTIAIFLKALFMSFPQNSLSLIKKAPLDSHEI